VFFEDLVSPKLMIAWEVEVEALAVDHPAACWRGTSASSSAWLCALVVR